MTTLSVALWATNLTQRLAGLDAWIAGVDARMAEAKARGADLLVMPEYACVQWLSFAPAGTATQAEIPWMAAQTPVALDALRRLVAKHGVALLAGSMPVAEKGKHVNAAFLLLPDGRTHRQDKLCLTPGEADPGDWALAPGDRFGVVEWKGLRIGVCICLDIELPALSVLLSGLDLDLVLVPSNTDTLAGYHRVFGCAKARAVEIQAAVCVVGTIGDVAYVEHPGTNVAGAAVYIPCENDLGFTGTLAELPPIANAIDEGPLLVAKDLPFAEIRRMRAGDAGVWPGQWSARHLTIDDPRQQIPKTKKTA
ncbi:MAG: nitrilase [Rhodospirillales bacterium]|nr:nitrilase [Rhodospirillales bacterium]